MSDTREPSEYLLGNTIIMRAEAYDRRTNTPITTYTVNDVDCFVRHEDDATATAVDVGAGEAAHIFEANFNPSKTGHWHYAFRVLGTPNVLSDGDFEVVRSDVGALP